MNKKHYTVHFDLKPLVMPNEAPAVFREKGFEIPFRGYQVEDLHDGRAICITKPGGKNTYGQVKIHDFMVWVYDQKNNDGWRISHKEIFDIIEAGLKTHCALTTEFVRLLKRVCEGEEPSTLDDEVEKFNAVPGLEPELILKVYKWIWLQEDCNYTSPKNQGRWKSMNHILKMAGLDTKD